MPLTIKAFGEEPYSEQVLEDKRYLKAIVRLGIVYLLVGFALGLV